MYFTSEKEETIIDIIKLEIEDIKFEIPLTKVFFPYNDSFYAKKHNHAHFEVFFNVKSKGEMLIDNSTVCFSDNSMIIIAPQIYHAYKPYSAQEADIIKYNLKFKYTSTSKSEELFDKFSFHYVENVQNILGIIERIHSTFTANLFASKQEKTSYFSILLIEILRIMTKDNPNHLPIKNENGEFANDYKANDIAEIEAFFENNYDTFPSPSDLAKHLCVSTRQLDRILKQLFSMSFSGKLLCTKTELAKDLLTTTDLSVVMISQKLGYTSPASFSAAFKKQTGTSPNSFRNKR